MRVYWYCPESNFTIFKDPIDNPSFRLRCWNNHLKLLEAGYFSRIVKTTDAVIDPDIVILTSFGERELDLAQRVKREGKYLIQDYSENIRGIPILEETKKLCSYLACCSTELARLESIVYGKKAITIKDPYEDFPIIKNMEYSNKKLKVVWSGMSGNAPLVENLLKPIVLDLDMEFVEISNRPSSTIQWDRNTWYLEMAKADICLCPQDQWNFPCKSNVKVTTAMALGVPVIASPLLSYRETIIDGENGFIAHTLEDWRNYLIQLKSKELREYLSYRAFETVKEYSIDNTYKKWEAMFKSLVG